MCVHKIECNCDPQTKRDFVDQYASAQLFGLNEVSGPFDCRYAHAYDRRIRTLKSLAFFGDAEKNLMPHMLIPLDGDEVKQFILCEARRVL